MGIQEAVKHAVEKNGYIRRKDLNNMGMWSDTLIRPTNSYDCCIILSKKENRQSRCWNPTADDLIADDWEVITG